jgi:hypothetical protein
MLLLMAFADGELEGEERQKAERILATQPDALRFVEQVGALGDWLQLGHEDRAAGAVARFDVADSVMTVAKAPKVASVTSLSSTRGQRARELSAAGSAPPSSSLKVGVGIAAALALAASVLVFARHRAEETPMATVATSQAPAVAAGATGTGVDVSAVNSPNNSVSVFYLPGANELSTSVVVWVEETGEK